MVKTTSLRPQQGIVASFISDSGALCRMFKASFVLGREVNNTQRIYHCDIQDIYHLSVLMAGFKRFLKTIIFSRYYSVTSALEVYRLLTR